MAFGSQGSKRCHGLNIQGEGEGEATRTWKFEAAKPNPSMEHVTGTLSLRVWKRGLAGPRGRGTSKISRPMKRVPFPNQGGEGSDVCKNDERDRGEKEILDDVCFDEE